MKSLRWKYIVMIIFLFCSFQIICSEQIDEIVIPSLDDIGPETTTFKPIEINVNHIRPNYSIDEKLSVFNINKIDAYIVNQYHFYTWKEYDEKLYPDYPMYNVFFSYHILFKTIYGYVFLGLFTLSGVLTKKWRIGVPIALFIYLILIVFFSYISIEF